MRIPPPTFGEEQALWNQGLQFVAGIDEVGRGAFAGPVVAAAVVLSSTFLIHPDLHDSKLMTHTKRLLVADHIKQFALTYSVASVSVPYINRFGVGKATQLAFRRAIKGLRIIPEYILIDAFYIKGIKRVMQKPIVKGDQKSISIAAASILAKVYRDSFMSSLPKKYQQYNFSIHKGYGTKMHQECMKLHGLCDLHRTSFQLSKFLS